jgi:transcriptional regulator with XRE-family HTH domain
VREVRKQRQLRRRARTGQNEAKPVAGPVASTGASDARRSRNLAARTGGRVSEAVLQNIESGRKADITVAQLLEISRALGISPLLLLAPLETPLAHIDLAGIGEELRSMTATEFDG